MAWKDLAGKAAVISAINAIGASVAMIDNIYDPVMGLFSKSSTLPKEHRVEIQKSGSEIVVRQFGNVVQIITGDDIFKLPEPMRSHIIVLEKSMRNSYRLWKKTYRKRNASTDSEVNAEVERKLREIVFNMKDDLDGILSYLYSCKIQLDDHYVEIRNLVERL